MAQHHVTPAVASLLEKQKSLNDAIDQYVSLAYEKDAQGIEVDVAQRRVASISSDIASLTKSEFWDAVTLPLQPLLNTPVRIALDLDLFNIITSSPTTVDEIVSCTSADRALIIRITRCLAAFHILNETAPNTFTSTLLSNTLTQPIVAAWNKANYDNVVIRNYKFPAFLTESHHRGPIDINTFNSVAFAGQSFWDELSARPSQLATFQLAMKIADTQPPDAAAYYDYTANLGTPPKSGITLIDVGGGHGHALESILTKHPNLPGKFILEDLSGTVEQLKADRSRNLKFEPVVHDFFTPQPPSMRPRWFFLRSILHDWPDESCVKILGHLRDAIADSENSSILLAELALPDTGAGKFDTLIDMNMMALGGMERSERQWTELLEKVGLNIKGVTRAKIGHRCILEVGLKEG